MRFGSLFAGIGGFDLGLERAGHECVFQVEKDSTCRRVLAKHFPDALRFDDVCDFNAAAIAIRPELLCGGFPCQDLSVAGKRAGLAGNRSGLFFEFMRIVGEFAPRWVLIENVPGLLSSNGGRDMGTVVGALGQLGYGWAYRVLDAQWFGVPQRRRRVFIVGCLGDRRSAARVLFEPESLPWDSPPRREARTRVAHAIARGTSSSGYRYDANGEEFVTRDIAAPLTRGSGVEGNDPGRRREDDVNLVAHTLRAEGHDASEDGTGRGVPLVAQCHGSNVGPMGTLRKGRGNVQSGVPFVFQSRVADNGRGTPSEIAYAVTDHGSGGQTDRRPQCVDVRSQVRRLTPVECARLQGFPDDWLAGESNSAQYRMLGNAVAVPVAHWIGQRLTEASP